MGVSCVWGPLGYLPTRCSARNNVSDGFPPSQEVKLEEDIEATAQALAEAVLEKKGRDVAILDMRGLVSYTDFFVLVTAANTKHAVALAEGVKAYGRDHLNRLPAGIEGTESGRWVLVDYSDVVVHIFEQPLRGFYDLDGLWADAPRIATPEVELPPDDPTEDEEYEPVFTFP